MISKVSFAYLPNELRYFIKSKNSCSLREAVSPEGIRETALVSRLSIVFLGTFGWALGREVGKRILTETSSIQLNNSPMGDGRAIQDNETDDSWKCEGCTVMWKCEGYNVQRGRFCSWWKKCPCWYWNYRLCYNQVVLPTGPFNNPFHLSCLLCNQLSSATYPNSFTANINLLRTGLSSSLIAIYHM